MAIKTKAETNPPMRADVAVDIFPPSFIAGASDRIFTKNNQGIKF